MSLSDQDTQALNLGITTAYKIGNKRGQMEVLQLMQAYMDAMEPGAAREIVAEAALAVLDSLDKLNAASEATNE